MDGGNSSSLKLCFAVKEHVHLSCSSGVLNIKKKSRAVLDSPFFLFTFFFPLTMRRKCQRSLPPKEAKMESYDKNHTS